MNLLQKFEQKHISKLTEGKIIPAFRPGDNVKIKVKIVEGNNERTQIFMGMVLKIKNRGLSSSFTVRKLSDGEGVERIFPLYSPRIENIEITRRGKVRRAKLYYMRELRGKKARIKELAFDKKTVAL